MLGFRKIFSFYVNNQGATRENKEKLPGMVVTFLCIFVDRNQGFTRKTRYHWIFILHLSIFHTKLAIQTYVKIQVMEIFQQQLDIKTKQTEKPTYYKLKTLTQIFFYFFLPRSFFTLFLSIFIFSYSLVFISTAMYLPPSCISKLYLVCLMIQHLFSS